MAVKTNSSPVLHMDDPGVDEETKRRIDEVLAPDIWRGIKKQGPVSNMDKKTKKKIIRQFTPMLFWNVNRDTMDLDAHRVDIVERVLERGEMRDWELLKKCYTLEGIIEIALKIRYLTPMALEFISSVANIPKEEFRCYKWQQLLPARWGY